VENHSRDEPENETLVSQTFSGESVVLTNSAVNIAVVIGGGSIAQVINQSNLV
jgi:uridylate kinase